jgi:transmembrane sensor
MTALGDLSADERHRLEQAAGWRLKLMRDPSLGDSEEYRRWCDDPCNARAREAVVKAWSSVGTLETHPEILELRRLALARMHTARSTRVGRWKKRGWAAVAAAAILAVGVELTWPSVHTWYCNAVTWLNTTSYKTDVGERRIVALSDGSRISMDSDTVVRVIYLQTTRSISLERGRSRFDVAHDPNRPFTVTAGAQTVVAIGTSFDVERLQSSVRVTLIQGQVVVKGIQPAAASEAGSAGATPISLKAGEELVLGRNLRPSIVRTDLQVARAWESGRLLFRDEPLGDAVARVNRYTAHPVEIDPSIAGIRFSGVFNAGDVSSFVSAVTSYFPVQAVTTDSNNIRLQPLP